MINTFCFETEGRLKKNAIKKNLIKNALFLD
mgnify:CR=1 FL=1